MSAARTHIRHTAANPASQRYAVYFSHGDRIEVTAKNKKAAKKRAVTRLYEWAGYCTRVLRLVPEEIREVEHCRTDRVRKILFPYHDLKEH